MSRRETARSIYARAAFRRDWSHDGSIAIERGAVTPVLVLAEGHRGVRQSNEGFQAPLVLVLRLLRSNAWTFHVHVRWRSTSAFVRPRWLQIFYGCSDSWLCGRPRSLPVLPSRTDRPVFAWSSNQATPVVDARASTCVAVCFLPLLPSSFHDDTSRSVGSHAPRPCVGNPPHGSAPRPCVGNPTGSAWA